MLRSQATMGFGSGPGFSSDTISSGSLEGLPPLSVRMLSSLMAIRPAGCGFSGCSIRSAGVSLRVGT
jgi:hypothetical protein